MRRLVAVPAEPGPELYRALRDAVDGSGPALLPVSSDPAEAARVLVALKPELPVEQDVCLVVPTSGSTGEPKGVLLTAECLLASAAVAVSYLGGPGSWWLALPVTHIGGLQVVLRSLLAGSEPRLGTVPQEASYCSLVPTQLRRLLVTHPAELACYEAVLLGGAATPPDLLDAARAAHVRVVTTYGMSETSGGCVYDGLPLPGVSVDVTDRIVLSGPVVAQGYRLRPDLTAQSFSGDRFTTSDLGELVDGRLHVLGRADDLIVTGGEKVAPLAVEAALARHPSVVDVVVVGIPDADWGSRVVAVVVLRADLSLAAAREVVGAAVSRVAAPRSLVVVDALPDLSGGKVDRAAARLVALDAVAHAAAAAQEQGP